MTLCFSVSALLYVALLAQPCLRLGREPKELLPDLRGHVAVVTGASRGIGRGIAVGLGEARCKVYVTGRGQRSPVSGELPVSLEETCSAVTAAGGSCVPILADSSNDTQLAAAFDRVIEEHGRIDILVNNAFSAFKAHSDAMLEGRRFWELPPGDFWDELNVVGLRSHYVASTLAAKHMVERHSGLIVMVSSFGGMWRIGQVAYDVGKAGLDRMATDMAAELATENVTSVSLWPGMVATDAMVSNSAFSNISHCGFVETELFSGRAVAALARDVRRHTRTGRVLWTAQLARDYGIVDERGLRPAMLPSLKWLLGGFLSLIGLLGDPPGTSPRPEGLASSGSRLFWNELPSLDIPAWLLRLSGEAVNLEPW